MVFIPPLTPGHVDPESERYNARSRIRDSSLWAIGLGWLITLTRRGWRTLTRPRDPYRW